MGVGLPADGETPVALSGLKTATVGGGYSALSGAHPAASVELPCE
jgi:hypothetical protein